MIIEDLVARTLLPALFGLIRYLYLVTNGMVFSWRLCLLNTAIGGAVGYVAWDLLPDNKWRDSVQALIGVASWEIIGVAKLTGTGVLAKLIDSPFSPKIIKKSEKPK